MEDEVVQLFKKDKLRQKVIEIIKEVYRTYPKTSIIWLI